MGSRIRIDIAHQCYLFEAKGFESVLALGQSRLRDTAAAARREHREPRVQRSARAVFIVEAVHSRSNVPLKRWQIDQHQRRASGNARRALLRQHVLDARCAVAHAALIDVTSTLELGGDLTQRTLAPLRALAP